MLRYRLRVAYLALLSASLMAFACQKTSDKGAPPKALTANESARAEHTSPGGLDFPDRWNRVTEENLDREAAAKLAKAREAQKSLGKQLLTTLTQAVSEGDYARGIDVCHVEAPQIAARVAKERGLQIGRTSHKLRNPQNQPPDWAEPIVEHQIDEPVVVQGPSGALGYTSPIMTAAMCTQCHGDAASLAKPVQATIAERYPRDRATGFSEGDLRGWFWVQVD